MAHPRSGRGHADACRARARDGVSCGLGAPEVYASRAATAKEWLLFDSTRTGRSEIYALPASSGPLRQLTFSGGLAPRPAPDGRFILFDRSDGTWMMRADGRGEKLLSRGAAQAAWAPDSRRIAYLAETGGIRVANRDGSGRRAVTTDTGDRYPQWSPDGRAIGFLNGESLLVLRGGRRTTVATDVTGAFAWSPTGRQIAYRSGSTLVVMNANGSGRRTVAEGWHSDEAAAGPVWSPDGKYVVYADVRVHVVHVASDRSSFELQGCGDFLTSRSEPVWSRGNAIAFVSNRSLICTSADGGAASMRRVEDTRPAARPFGLAWTTPPRGVHYRKAVSVRPTAVVATPAGLKAKSPIDEIAADGTRVAFRACHEVGVWTAGALSYADVLHEWPLCSARSSTRVWGPALAGDVAGYGTACCVMGSVASLEVSHLGTNDHASITGPATLGVLAPGIGFMLGQGPLLVFSIWLPGMNCNGPLTPCPDPQEQSLWRLPLPLTSGGCTGGYGAPGPPCVKIAAGPVVPLAVDDARIVVRHVDGSIAVLGADGREQLSLPLKSGEAAAAAIAGSDLVVLVAGALRDYHSSSGQLLHEWPLPRVSIGGVCGIYLARCGTPELRLEGAARGLAAYILDGNLHLLRLRDGADTIIAQATAAQIEDVGLFYAYKGAYPYVGRIRFVPFDQMPLQ